MKPALRAALGGGKVSAGVCVTIGNLNELISVGLCPIFGGARLRFYVGLYAVQLGHPGRYLHDLKFKCFFAHIVSHFVIISL